MAELLTIVSPYGPEAASSRVRVYDWLRHLRLDPSAARISSYVGLPNAAPRALLRRPLPVARAERHLRELARTGGDAILIHRQASPLSRGGIDVALLRGYTLGVYDFDDALQWDHARGLATSTFPRSLQCRRAVQTADRVIAGSAVLAGWASEHCADVRLIPSCVEPDDYVVKADYAVADVPRLVWLGSPATERYLPLLEEPLLALHRRTGARLTVISAGGRALGALDAMVDRVEWTRSGFAAELVRADVAVAPLRDELYARGKCAYKILQYAAAGIPTVVSPIGANREAADKLGFACADSAADWREQLEQLLTDSAQARRRIGHGARAAVEEHYSFAAWRDAWQGAVGLTASDA